MLLVFWMVFSAPVISRIESIRGGWVGGSEVEGGSWWGAVGWLKHQFRLKEQCCTFSMGHKLIQSTREAKTAVRSSFVPHAILIKPPGAMEKHPHGFTALVKSRL